MSHLLRARFKKEIVCEFLPPAEPSRDVIIFCDGMPTIPGNKRLLIALSKKGFWVFDPRYRGTWESGGRFLDHDPTQDILDIIDELPNGFVSLYDNVRYQVDPRRVYVVGASFGGPAAILSTLDPRVTKAIAVCPVVDWSDEDMSPEEPMDWLGGFVRDAFGEAYRFSDEDWQRLSRGEFYNPISHIKKLDPSKLMIVQTLDDTIVAPHLAVQFARALGCELYSLKKGGHVPKKLWTSWWTARRLFSFLDN